MFPLPLPEEKIVTLTPYPQLRTIMPLSLASLPTDFSWLRATYRPSDQEVDTYAHLIANAEGYPKVSTDSRLFDEAELQLWIWRTEMRKRASRTRRTP